MEACHRRHGHGIGETVFRSGLRSIVGQDNIRFKFLYFFLNPGKINLFFNSSIPLGVFRDM